MEELSCEGPAYCPKTGGTVTIYDKSDLLFSRLELGSGLRPELSEFRSAGLTRHLASLGLAVFLNISQRADLSQKGFGESQLSQTYRIRLT